MPSSSVVEIYVLLMGQLTQIRPCAEASLPKTSKQRSPRPLCCVVAMPANAAPRLTDSERDSGGGARKAAARKQGRPHMNKERANHLPYRDILKPPSRGGEFLCREKLRDRTQIYLRR